MSGKDGDRSGSYKGFTLHLRVPLLVQDNIDYKIDLEDLRSSSNSRAGDGRATDARIRAKDREHSSSDNKRGYQQAHVNKGHEPQDSHATSS